MDGSCPDIPKDIGTDESGIPVLGYFALDTMLDQCCAINVTPRLTRSQAVPFYGWRTMA